MIYNFDAPVNRRNTDSLKWDVEEKALPMWVADMDFQTVLVVVPNDVLHHKVWRAINTDEVAEPGAFAVDAAVAAFTEGEAWLNCTKTIGTAWEAAEFIRGKRDYIFRLANNLVGTEKLFKIKIQGKIL